MARCRVAQELALQGINVEWAVCVACGQRHDLLSKHDRCCASRKTHREQTIELNDEQINLLRHFSPEFRERQIEVHYTGNWWRSAYLLRRRTQGVGKVYLQPCWAGTAATPETALHQQAAGDLRSMCSTKRSCKLFEAHEARVYTILSDNGREVLRDALTITLRAVPAAGGLSTRTTKVRGGHRATVLSSGYIAPCWMNTSVSGEDNLV